MSMQVNFTHAFSWKEGHEMIMHGLRPLPLPSVSSLLATLASLAILSSLLIHCRPPSIYRSLSNIQPNIYICSIQCSQQQQQPIDAPSYCSLSMPFNYYQYSSKEPQSDSSHRITIYICSCQSRTSMSPFLSSFSTSWPNQTLIILLSSFVEPPQHSPQHSMLSLSILPLHSSKFNLFKSIYDQRSFE